MDGQPGQPIFNICMLYLQYIEQYITIHGSVYFIINEAVIVSVYFIISKVVIVSIYFNIL